MEREKKYWGTVQRFLVQILCGHCMQEKSLCDKNNDGNVNISANIVNHHSLPQKKQSFFQINHYSVSPVAPLLVLVTTQAHKATALLATIEKEIKV